MPIVDAGPALKLHFSEMEWTEHVVKVYPEIFRAAEKSNQWSRHHRLWIIIRYLSRNDCGWTAMDDIYRVAAELDGLAPGTVRRYLIEGDGVWWDRDRGRVRFKSAKKMACYLKVKVSDPMLMPLPLTLADFRAAVTFAFDREQPIANETIANGIGRTKTTVNNYKKRLGEELDIRANWRGTGIKGEIKPEGKYRTASNGEIIEQMPNTYTPHYAKPAAPGQVRRINRAVNQLLEPVERRTRRPARYLDNSKSVARRMGKMVEGDCFYERQGGLWVLHECRNGQWWTWGVEENVNFFTLNTYRFISDSSIIEGRKVNDNIGGVVL